MARTAPAQAGMIDLKSLQKQVLVLVADLRERVAADGALRADLTAEYGAAKKAGRVGASFETWLGDVLDQAAVAWVLGCVFLRFCEDNGLIERLWLGGADEHAPMERAMQNRQKFLVDNPLKNDRDWLRSAFTYLAGLRATGHIFDKRNPVWRFDISGEAAEQLCEFFRRGGGAASLRSDSLDTRFLGDLYQDLSKHARDTYALLQTPEFVEEFILDRAFEPALAEFGLARMSVIDPTCGSGHFLLGAFHRLVRRWRDREPGTDIRELVERALGQVTGVDINPFAVAVARFRLMVAALTACGLSRLESAPAFPVRVAAGDSLLEWGSKSSHQGDLVALAEGGDAFAYATEDADLLAEYLEPGQYTVVVGNPPYIPVRDGSLSKLYRTMYGKVCVGAYTMSVPFAMRFFALALRSDGEGEGAGWIGQITGNSFMRQNFGKRLIEQYFAYDVEVSSIIDTSGAYIPGHGTPTVVLIGRNNARRRADTIFTMAGVRGEPGTPINPATGKVWSAIVAQASVSGSISEWVEARETPREAFLKHPWVLGSEDGVRVKAILDSASQPKLGAIVEIGTSAVPREHEAFGVGAELLARKSIPLRYQRELVGGECVRDWGCLAHPVALWPYETADLAASTNSAIVSFLWPLKAPLAHRTVFGQTQVERGLSWTEYSMFFRRRFGGLSITFPVVATSNHFMLDRHERVFKQSAPVIKLEEGATEEEHLQLLGVLNSSTACFWLKQVSHNKGSTVDQRGARQTTVAWENFYEFTGTKLEQFPLPERFPLELSRELDQLAQRLATLTPEAVTGEGVPNRERLAAARAEYELVRARMIGLQEELDWETYHLYGLIDEPIVSKEAPELRLGDRAFEIVLARKIEAGEAEAEWFTRHGSTPISELPTSWSPEYRAVVDRRINAMESDRNIGLIERPEYKRRWSSEGWDAMQMQALRDWLLDRLEAPELWGGSPTPLSVAQLADRLRHDEDFRSVLDLWVGTAEHDLTRTLGKLVADEHVPYLPADRYKPEGLRKRAQWERTWTLQRLEDKDNKRLDIPVPPKYTSADFVKASYWRARGKLDVPKERFVSYPRMGRDADKTELLGWAGWDHLAQARALAGVYLDRKNNAGWPAERLLPLLAGIAELEPWLHQWYTDPRPDFPGSPAEFITSLLDAELSVLGADRNTLRQLRGVEELSVEEWL
jgi:hypothetical protein